MLVKDLPKITYKVANKKRVYTYNCEKCGSKYSGNDLLKLKIKGAVKLLCRDCYINVPTIKEGVE